MYANTHQPCANESALRIHLARIDADEQRAQLIDERTAALLAGDYAPFNTTNVAEAIGELQVISYEALAKLLSTNNLQGAGLVLHTLINDYWERFARETATNQIDNELAYACRFCLGKGCPRCDEDYGKDR